jgi:archaeal type IV pilus assembly protein PilA
MAERCDCGGLMGMTGKYSRNENAVSPVIAVMLMLIVTVIVAALVSAFGGNLMQTEKKVPQASFSGHYSQMNGLSMTHTGGDSLETQDIQVIIRPSDEFGRGQSEYGQLFVNASSITNGQQDVGKPGLLSYWRNYTDGTYGVMSWRAGETMYVKGGADLQSSGLINKKDWPPCYNTALQGGSTGNEYCFVTSLNNQINVGKTVTVEIMAKNGKMISSFPMVIEP